MNVWKLEFEPKTLRLFLWWRHSSRTGICKNS